MKMKKYLSKNNQLHKAFSSGFCLSKVRLSLYYTLQRYDNGPGARYKVGQLFILAKLR